MRLFFRQRIPHFHRVLLVESGSRAIADNLLPGLNDLYGDKLRLDLVTCYTGEPIGLRPDARVYRVWNYPDPAARNRLLKDLESNRYEILGILCSGEPIMTKWKWWLAWKLPAKVFILNENGDYFWFDYTNLRTLAHFALFRAGLAGGDAVTTLTRLLLFPFMLCYLLLYAGSVHLRRKARI